MAFAVPEGLAPEVYPLGWLLGTWRGPGFLAYPEISERPFVQEVTFGHDGGPYLSYTSAIRLLDEDAVGGVQEEEAPVRPEAAVPEVVEVPAGPRAGAMSGSTEVRYTAGPVWAVESGYWRPAPGETGGTAGLRADDAQTAIEVLLAEPTGHVSIYLGTVRGPRVEIATDLVARTSTAVEVSAVHRMYGLVGGELMWALDMAAFGHELRPYASARLNRQPTPVGDEGAEDD